MERRRLADILLLTSAMLFDALLSDKPLLHCVFGKGFQAASNTEFLDLPLHPATQPSQIPLECAFFRLQGSLCFIC